MNLPSTLTMIKESAFSICSGLTSLKLPDSVVSVGNTAIIGCYNVKTLKLPGSLRSLSFGAFTGMDLRTVQILAQVAYIGENAFRSNYNLELSFSWATLRRLNQTHFWAAVRTEGLRSLRFIRMGLPLGIAASCRITARTP